MSKDVFRHNDDSNAHKSSSCFVPPARLAFTLYMYHSRALAYFFQAGQGRLNEPHPGTVRSDPTGQSSQALGVKRALGQFRA